jgi:nitroreductase
MRILRFVLVCVLCLLFTNNSVLATSFEETVSQRQSVRSYTIANITSEQLMSILSAAYGYADAERVLPRIGAEYSLAIYVVNNTACYLYNPEANSFSLYNSSVNKETIRPHVGWVSDASAVLVIVWNQTRMSNQYFASIEAGCLTQNVYLAAITRNLGTCCVGGMNLWGLSVDLNLPWNTLTPILVMPLGYPISDYPYATPAYERMTGNLPLVQISDRSLTDALNNLDYVQAWSEQSLSIQDISQVLWAAYGYSSTFHRTTPSAEDAYPLVVYVSNYTGVYRYIAENHSVMLVQFGDKRSEIAAACGNQLWAASAPAIFLVALNSSYNGGNIGDGGVLEHEWVEVDAGCVAQQILLEGSATNLTSNFIANGLETWNGSGAQSLRSSLNLTPDVIFLYIMPVGHPVTPVATPSPTPTASPSPSPTASPSSTPSPTPSTTPTPSPPIPEFQSFLVIGLLLVCAASILVLLKLARKRDRVLCFADRE